MPGATQRKVDEWLFGSLPKLSIAAGSQRLPQRLAPLGPNLAIHLRKVLRVSRGLKEDLPRSKNLWPGPIGKPPLSVARELRWRAPHLGGRQPIRRPKLPQNVMDMVLYGLLGEVQLGGYFLFGGS